MKKQISPAPRNSAEIFGLTEREQLFSRIGKKRFEQILNDEQTVVHDIHEDANDFGDFLFVTTSRPGDVGKSRAHVLRPGLPRLPRALDHG